MACKITSKYNYWGGTDNQLVASYIPFQFNDEVVVQKAKSIELKFVQQVVDTTTNVDSIQKPISVYPNPSNGIYYLSTTSGTFDFWTVTSLDGVIIKTQRTYNDSMAIDLTDLPSGVYLFKVQINGFKYSQKLIKI
jgi:Secretion system C-terminal sorting domain